MSQLRGLVLRPALRQPQPPSDSSSATSGVHCGGVKPLSQTKPLTQSLDCVQLVGQAPPAHRYGSQDTRLPSVSSMARPLSTQRAVEGTHCALGLQRLPGAQSVSRLHSLLQAAVSQA
jgi:hypothetical protein